MLYFFTGKPESRAAYPLLLEGYFAPELLISNEQSEADIYPPDERKEGDANVCYIL